MNVARDYILESLNDGEGIRTVIFVGGCLHYCKGCHNPETHDFNYGIPFTKDRQFKLINKIKSNPLIDGITISGGDSMFSPQDIYEFIKLFKQECPNLNIWIYSGFTFEQIIKNINRKKVLELCDVLVDGKFIEELRDTTILFRGSSNQRIIDIKESLKQNKIILYLD